MERMDEPRDDAPRPSLGEVAADLIELVANTRPGPKPYLDRVLLRAALMQWGKPIDILRATSGC